MQNKILFDLVGFNYNNPPSNYEDMQINHLDCNKLNNHKSNLEWVTSMENYRHAQNNRLFSGSKLTTYQVLDIINNLCAHIPVEYLAKKHNVSVRAILSIKYGRSWVRGL